MQDLKLEKLASALEHYIKDNGISQNECAKSIGVSPSYLTHILNRNFDQIPAGKTATGAPRFTRLSEHTVRKVELFLGLSNEIWEIDNYMIIFNILGEAKKYKEHRLIDGLKGSGKTFTAKDFKRQFPQETYLITCSGDMSPKDFMMEIAEQLGVNSMGSRRKIRLAIADKLKKQNTPLIIIDEAENLKPGAYESIKALYDDVKDFAGMVLLGANNYLDFLRKRAASNRGCFPQLFSRFSAEPGLLSTMSLKDVRYVCQLNGISDKETINRLFDTCSDYRELDRNVQRIIRDRQLTQEAA
jgi:DNA transposition AAA+ family ATPase